MIFSLIFVVKLEHPKDLCLANKKELYLTIKK